MSKLFGKIYRVVENPFEKDAGIELIDSEWKGLVYQYGDVQFVEGQPELNFQRTIRRLPKAGGDMDELLNNTELETLMGDILVGLMEEQIERDKNEQSGIESTD